MFPKNREINLKQNMALPIKISQNGENSPQKKISGYLLIGRKYVCVFRDIRYLFLYVLFKEYVE